MKQRILHSFRLRAVMLVAMLCAAVTGAWAEEVTDELTRTWTGVTNTSYTAWSNKKLTSNAVYAGNSAGGNSSIQLRSSSNSGVVTTASGGKVKSITVVWNSSTANGRTLNVYGKNSAYSTASELYNASTQGTLLGTIAYGTSTSLTISGDYEYIGFRSASGAMYLTSVSIVWETGGGSGSSAVATPTFSPAAGTYTSAQNVTLSTTTDGATIYYTTDGTDPTTSSDVYSSAISVNSTTTIKAMAVKEGMDNSSVAEAAYTILSIEHAGTEADPYTVADARTAIDANTGLTNVYVAGIVCTGGSSLSSGSLNYWISDDGTETNKFEIYKGKGIGNADFTSTDDIQEGDVVVVYGNITKYNSTYEFSSGSHLVSLDRPVTPSITADNVEIEYNATSSSIDFTVNNETQDGVLTAAITAGNEGSWLSLGDVTTSVPLTCSANEGNTDRTATVTLTYTYNTNETVTKAVTVTQKHFVVDYAELPFAFNNGKAAIEETIGLTHEGLGSDYSLAPKLKFDSTNDCLVLKINERPGVLTFDIKNNSFSGGTFKLQTSEDGTNYTDHKSYTEITGTQSEEIDDLGENVRYIKWIYTNKSSGNVGLGNIALTKYVSQSNSAPVWTALPTPTINANEAYDLNLSDYVSGNPTPTITLTTAVSSSLYEFEDGWLVFEPSAAGTYEFTFTATNTQGSANATLTVTAEAVPFITADNVEIDYNATGGDIEFTLNNEVTGGVISASTTADWLTLGSETSSPISFTCSANEGNTDRTATVTLTYTYNTNETVTKDVTVTQSHLVVDYATLPFEWEGGASSDFLALSGVTANNLGGDYASGNAPYLIKLDNTDDYIQVKTDGQPGKVTIDVKMLGGDNTSTITVQESADGETFTAVQVLTISGAQNNVLSLETTNAFKATTRYVRLLFTKGSNVGVGPISIAVPSSNPEIMADASVELIAEATSGEIVYSINNPDGVTSLEATSDDAWISNINVTTTKVTFTTSVNTGAARVGTITLTYGSLTKDVTVTQAEHVDINTYTLATTITSGKHYVIAATASNVTKAMGGKNADKPYYEAIDVELNESTLSVASNSGIQEFVIYGPDAEGYYSIYDPVAGGYLYPSSTTSNDLSYQTENNDNGLWTIDSEEQTVTSLGNQRVLRYNSGNPRFSCYASGQTAVQFYEKDGEATPTESKTLNGYGYATYASQNALDFTNATDVTAWTITGINGNEITFSQIEGSAPAGTGLFLKGEASGSVTMTSATGASALTGNLLEAVTANKTVTDGEYFGLKGNEFVPVNAGTIPAGKALLPATKVPNEVKAFTFVFVNTATGVRTVETVSAEDAKAIFNLAGQRLSKTQRGINIVNGKKVVVK